MTTRWPPTRLAMPWATMYSTSECISSWEMPRSLAARTTALAMEWGEVLFQTCGQLQNFALVTAGEGYDLHYLRGGTGEGAGLIKHDGICLDSASRYLPPLTVMW